MIREARILRHMGPEISGLSADTGYTGISGLSTQIKNSYARVILPCKHVRASPLASLATAPHGDSQLHTHTNMPKRCGKRVAAGCWPHSQVEIEVEIWTLSSLGERVASDTRRAPQHGWGAYGEDAWAVTRGGRSRTVGVQTVRITRGIIRLCVRRHNANSCNLGETNKGRKLTMVSLNTVKPVPTETNI